MARRGGAVHVVTTKREYKGKTYSSHLLRRSYREGDKVKNETVGNLSHLPDHVIEIIRQSLRGQAFSPAAEAFEITASAPHGHIQAVRTAMRRLGFEDLLAPRSGPERALVVAMVVARIVAPQTKLATTRWWHTSTLAEDLGVVAASEDDLYAAMDWLLARQEAIEKKLLFADEDQAAKKTRDPVAPAQCSDEAAVKAASHALPDGSPVHSFRSLMDVLATIVRNSCRAQGSDDDSPTFAVVTTPNASQRRAISLLEAIAP